VRTSALPEIAEDSNQSRWDRARLRLFLPIGLIVAVAVVCLIIAIVTSARRANEVTLDRDEQLLQQAIAGRAIRMLREVESVAATNGATEKIRETYDPLWTESRVGNWLQVYFGHDLVLVVDGSDHVQYGRARHRRCRGH
jgi:sensor domain CHASE-containing protein